MRPLPSPDDPAFWRDNGNEALLMLSPHCVMEKSGKSDVALERICRWLFAARRQLLAGRLQELRLADGLGRRFIWRRFDPLRIWRRATRLPGDYR